jgi:hypothetical protein
MRRPDSNSPWRKNSVAGQDEEKAATAKLTTLAVTAINAAGSSAKKK